jgi:membrane-associated phospholipid phosphatase
VVRLGVATGCWGAIFVAIALAHRAGLTQGLDHATNVLLGSIDNSTLDAIGQADDGLARVIPTFAVAGLMSFVLAWKGRRWAWIVPLFIAFTGIVEFLAKLGLGRGLHLAEILAAAREFIGFRYHTGASFPSGHVARTVFLATAALPHFSLWVALPLVSFAALTFAARLYTEAHSLSDVLGGAALGMGAAFAGLWLRAILSSRSASRSNVAKKG